MRNERGDFAANITEVHRIIRDRYEHLYVNKLGNLEKKDKFLERYNLPRLNHGEIKRKKKDLNRPIMSKGLNW